jgi:hypothetical protein
MTNVFTPPRRVLDDPEWHPVVKAAYPTEDSLNRADQFNWAINAWLKDHPGCTRDEAGPIVAAILDAEEKEHSFLCIYANQIMGYSKSIIDSVAVIRGAVRPYEPDLWTHIDRILRSATALARFFEVSEQYSKNMKVSKAEKKAIEAVRQYRMKLLLSIILEHESILELRNIRNICEHLDEYFERDWIRGLHMGGAVRDMIVDTSENIKSSTVTIIRSFEIDTWTLNVLDETVNLRNVGASATALLMAAKTKILLRGRYHRQWRALDFRSLYSVVQPSPAPPAASE